MSTPVITKYLKTMWRTIRPWIPVVTILLVLRYTGALAGLSALGNRAVLETGILDANPDRFAKGKEPFDFDFSVKKTDGTPVDFRMYRGKTVFLNIWATWCGPCRAEMASIQKLYDAVGNDSVTFVMLSIDREDATEKVIDYIAGKGFTFPVFIAGELPEQLQVKMIPSTFIIAPDGTIAYKKSGMADYNTSRFRKFLGELSTTAVGN